MPAKETPTAIDAYLADLSDKKRATLQKLRTVIKAAAPKAEECISYGIPAFRQNGPLVGFAAAKNHYSFYPMSASTIAEHQDRLVRFETSKGAIRFQADHPLPVVLVRKLVKARLAENLEKSRSKIALKKL